MSACILAIVVSTGTLTIPFFTQMFSHQILIAAQPVVNPAANKTMNTAGPQGNMSSSTSMGTATATKLDCPTLGKTLGGIPVPNGNVCDVVVVRKSPQIMGHNGMVMNKFTLMNSVLEFMPVQGNATSMAASTSANPNVYVMGDFALLESEMNPVLQSITKAGWTVTGIHNHMILESPKTSFMHWETQGNLNTIVGQIKDALAQTSIQK
jgi:hypothetical protein